MTNIPKKCFKDLTNTNKPREKMREFGAKNLTVTELLAILLNTGSNKYPVMELAKKINKPNLSQLFQLTEKEICQYSGIGVSKASTLLAAFELARRYKDDSELVSLDNPSKIFYQTFDIKDCKQEICLALYVNGSKQLLHKKTLAIGSLNQNFLEFRQILEPAITIPASGFFLVHNHPSGNCQPSQQDIEVTKQIAKGANLMGIELIDHIIVSSKNYLSLQQSGYL